MHQPGGIEGEENQAANAAAACILQPASALPTQQLTHQNTDHYLRRQHTTINHDHCNDRALTCKDADTNSERLSQHHCEPTDVGDATRNSGGGAAIYRKGSSNRKKGVEITKTTKKKRDKKTEKTFKKNFKKKVTNTM